MAEIAVPAVEVVREVPAAPVAPPIERAPSAVSAGTEPEVTPSLAVRSARPGSAAISEPPQVERAPVAPDADSSQKLAVRTAVVYEPGPGSAKVDKGIAASEASLAPDSGIDKAGPRDGEGRRRAGVWIPLSVAAVLVAVTGATWILVSGMLSRGNTAVDPALVNRINQERYRQTGWQEEARSVLEQFLSARTTSGKAAWSLRGAELLPAMEKFYEGSPIDDSDTPVGAFSAMELPSKDTDRGIYMLVYDLPPQFELKEFFRPLVPLDVQFGLERADVLLQSVTQISNFQSEPLKVYAFFKRTPDGLRLDWETFVQTKYRTFRDFIELPEAGRSGIFRVYLLEDVPEKGRAPAGTRTYQVVDPAHTSDAVRVSVPVDSEMGRALSILNWRGVKDARPSTRTATVELEWSQEESPRVQLKRFICWEFLGLGGEAVSPGAGR